MTDLTACSAARLSQLLAARQTSSEEITRAYLRRIDAEGDRTNCYLSIEGDSAIQQARSADRAIARNERRHPLTGVPVAIKDIFQREGATVTAGSAPFAFRSSPTATVVKRLEEASVVILGTLNLDEFAAGGTGANMHFGRCRNPVDGGYLSGGSSSGSAAAVGARLAAITLGSDAGGSIRLPAGWCGVTGLKPTYGRVSRFGAVPRTWSMDCIGPLGRSAEDCALMLDLIGGGDDADPTSFTSAESFWPLDPPDLSQIRIGISTPLFESTEAAIQPHVVNAAAAFNSMGAAVTEVDLPDIGLLNDLQQVVVKSEGAAFLGAKLRATPNDISRETRSVIQEGFVLPASSYVQALGIRATMLKNFVEQVFDTVDALLLPLSSCRVPRFIEDNDSATAAEIDRQFTATARFTRFANYLGIPGIAFPVATDDHGMPVAVQLLAKPWAEKKLLQIVNEFQRSTNS